MGKNIIIFLLCFALGLGGGYLIFNDNDEQDQATTEEPANTEDREQTDEEMGQQKGSETAAAEGEILNQRGCISCHSVSALNLQGGATGPDLSQAYVNVEQKHGLPIEEYLKNPTSAVMSSVISGNPLTDEELEAVIAALKTASEK